MINASQARKTSESALDTETLDYVDRLIRERAARGDRKVVANLKINASLHETFKKTLAAEGYKVSYTFGQRDGDFWTISW